MFKGVTTFRFVSRYFPPCSFWEKSRVDQSQSYQLPFLKYIFFLLFLPHSIFYLAILFIYVSFIFFWLNTNKFGYFYVFNYNCYLFLINSHEIWLRERKDQNRDKSFISTTSLGTKNPKNLGKILNISNKYLLFRV